MHQASKEPKLKMKIRDSISTLFSAILAELIDRFMNSKKSLFNPNEFDPKRNLKGKVNKKPTRIITCALLVATILLVSIIILFFYLLPLLNNTGWVLLILMIIALFSLMWALVSVAPVFF